MGGKKKLSLKQMERTQKKRDDQEKRKKKETATVGKEKKPLGIVPPDLKDTKMIGELKKMRVLTPYAVASRLNIRTSAAKVFLRRLNEQGVIQLVSGDHNIKIYKPVD